MEATKQQIASIFNGHRVLEVPFYQRSYVWQKEQWQRFLEDMEAMEACDTCEWCCLVAEVHILKLVGSQGKDGLLLPIFQRSRSRNLCTNCSPLFAAR